MRAALTLSVLLACSSISANALAADDFVVVAATSPLFAKPKAGEAAIRVAKDGFVTLRKLGQKGGWIKVEANAPLPDTCAPRAWAVDPLILELWVPQKSLQDVAAGFLTTSHDDGTLVTVVPGTPLRREGKTWVADLGGAAWPVAPKDGELGKSFRPAASSSSEGTWMLAKGDLRIGGQAIKGTDGEGFRVTNELQEQAKTRFRLSMHCATAVVAGTFEAPNDAKVGGILGSLMGSGATSDHWSVPIGTRVSWPDGTSAGRFARQAAVLEATKKGSQLCAKFGDVTPVELCFAAADARRQGGGSPFGFGGLGLRGAGKATDASSADAGMSRAVVRRVMRQKQPNFEACRTQAGLPLAGERVEFFFTIGPDGSVSGAAIGGVGSPTPADPCLLRVVGGLIFPARKGRAPEKVSHSVLFEASP